jgi:hypothetical protein
MKKYPNDWPTYNIIQSFLHHKRFYKPEVYRRRYQNRKQGVVYCVTSIYMLTFQLYRIATQMNRTTTNTTPLLHGPRQQLRTVTLVPVTRRETLPDDHSDEEDQSQATTQQSDGVDNENEQQEPSDDNEIAGPHALQ